METLAEMIDAYALPSFTFEPWRRAATPDRVKKAFADCGIFPFNPEIVLSSPKLATSTSFTDPSRKGEAAANRTQPPLPASPTVLVEFLRHVDPAIGVTLDDFRSRALHPFLNHFLAINKHLFDRWINDYAQKIVTAGPDAEPAPLFDNPTGPTGPSFKVPLIGESVSDVLNTNNPEHIAKITTARNKRKRHSALTMPSGGLLTTNEIADKFHQDEKGLHLSLPLIISSSFLSNPITNRTNFRKAGSRGSA